MTEKKLLKMIAEGAGQGHGEMYRPFLRNTRSSISSKGTQGTGKVLYGLKRPAHFKSRQEKRIARALQWLGAIDVREQFPLWPMPHPHPLCGACGTELLDLPDVPGLLDIASDAGINHGAFIGSDIPYVATLDFMVTIRTAGVTSLVGLSCKDEEIVFSNDPLSRALERLELERRYCHSIQSPYHIVSRASFTDTLLANLEWLLPDEFTTGKLSADARLPAFAELLRHTIHSVSIENAVESASRSVAWSNATGQSAFRLLAWRQAIDIDLSQPIALTLPASTGGQAVHRLLRHTLYGATDEHRPCT
jgi:TnsA endonuclease N terminal